MDPGIKIIGNVLRDISIIILVNYSLKNAQTPWNGCASFQVLVANFLSLYAHIPHFFAKLLEYEYSKHLRDMKHPLEC